MTVEAEQNNMGMSASYYLEDVVHDILSILSNSNV